MDDDVIFLLDWKGIKLHSNGGFMAQRDPEGKLYYTVRNTDGYIYITDMCFFGELVVNTPSCQGVIHDISY